MTTKNGDKCWRNAEGEFHRTDGPAIEWHNGDKEWYLNGVLHRTDGPAIDSLVHKNEWWVNGRRFLDEESFRKAVARTSTIKEKIIDSLREMSNDPSYNDKKEVLENFLSSFVKEFPLSSFEIKKDKDRPYLFSLSFQSKVLGEFNTDQLKELHNKISNEVLTSDEE